MTNPIDHGRLRWPARRSLALAQVSIRRAARAATFAFLGTAGCAVQASGWSAAGPDHPASAQAQESPLPAMPAALGEGVASTSAHPGPAARPAAAVAPGRTPARYVCPMHPEVVASAPGECPVCGMDLEPTPADAGHAGDGGEEHPRDHR